MSLYGKGLASPDKFRGLIRVKNSQGKIEITRSPDISNLVHFLAKVEFSLQIEGLEPTQLKKDSKAGSPVTQVSYPDGTSLGEEVII